MSATTAAASSQAATSTLFVSNLSWSVSEAELDQFLRDAEASRQTAARGPPPRDGTSVHAVHIPLDATSGRSQGYAFVACRDVSGASSLRSLVDGSSLAGRTIQVAFAKKKKQQVIARAFGAERAVGEEEQTRAASKGDIDLASRGAEAPSCTSAPLTKSAKRRLKRQRAIADATKVPSDADAMQVDDGVETTSMDADTSARASRKRRRSAEVIAPTTAADATSAICGPIEAMSVASPIDQPVDALAPIISFGDAVRQLQSDIAVSMEAIPPLEKYLQTPSSGATHTSNAAANTMEMHHACTKKLRLLVRAVARAWKQMDEIQTSYPTDVARLQDAGSHSLLIGLHAQCTAIFRCLIDASRHQLQQHLHFVFACVSPQSSSSVVSAALLALEQTATKKDSPLRQCRRIIDQMHEDWMRDAGDERTLRAAIMRAGGGDVSVAVASIQNEYRQYEFLLFRASRTCERLTHAESHTDLTLTLQQPPQSTAHPHFSDALMAAVDADSNALVSDCMIHSCDESRRLHRVCLSGLNAATDAEFDTLLAGLPSTPSLHARLRFLRSIVYLMRSTLRLPPGLVSLHVSGSFISGVATAAASDLDAQIVFARAVDRGALDVKQFGRHALVRMRAALRTKGIQVDAGQMQARTPVLAIQRNTHGANERTTSNKWSVPCDCDVGVMHEDEFADADWYKRATHEFSGVTAVGGKASSSLMPAPNSLKSMYLSRYLFPAGDDQQLVRRTFVILRRWAAARRINSAAENTLSTFSWMIMMIHALQRASPPLLLILPVSVCAPADDATIASVTPRRSVAEMVHQFFAFYAEFDGCAPLDITSDVAEVTTASHAALHASPLRLVDPIEPHENPARSMQTMAHWLRIKRECRRAAWIMEQARVNDDDADGKDKLASSLVSRLATPILASEDTQQTHASRIASLPWSTQLHHIFV